MNRSNPIAKSRRDKIFGGPYKIVVAQPSFLFHRKKCFALDFLMKNSSAIPNYTTLSTIRRWRGVAHEPTITLPPTTTRYMAELWTKLCNWVWHQNYSFLILRRLCNRWRNMHHKNHGWCHFIFLGHIKLAHSRL